MRVDGFKKLCSDAKLINGFLRNRDIDVCFHQAMMTQIDELHTTRHFEMSYVEFLEAICRAACKSY